MQQNELQIEPRNSPVPWAVLCLGALLTLAAAGWVRSITVRRTVARADYEAATIRRDLTESFHGYEEVMVGMRGLVLAKGGIDQATFHDYVTEMGLFSRHPGLLATTYGYFLDQADRAAFEQRMRAEWGPRGRAFAIHPPGERSQYFVVAYSEPLESGDPIIGTDTLTLAGNPASLAQALATDGVVASGPLTVVQHPGPDPGLILRLVVARHLRPGASQEQRRRAALGCINCVFRADQLIRDSLGSESLERNDVWIADAGPASGAPDPAQGRTPLFGTALPSPGPWQRLLRPCPPSVQVLELDGRRWDVHIALKHAFIGEQEWALPLGVAILGLLATLMFAGILRAETRVAQRSRRLAARMTRRYLEVGQELQRSQANLASVIESTGDMIWSVDREHRLLTYNAALSEHLFRSYGTRPVIGAAIDDCIPPGRARLWPHLYDRAMKSGAYQIDYPLGGDQVMDMAFHPILHGGGVVGVSVFGKDITDRKKGEELLRASEERYRKIVDRAPMGIFRRDLEGRFAYSSPGLWQQFGCSSEAEFLRDYPDSSRRWAHAEQHADFISALLQDGRVEGYVNEARLKDGSRRWHMLFAYLDRDDPGYFDGFSIDVTQLKIAEAERAKIKEQLHQSQKMDALGRLAGGIAHDFNNMLTGILGAAELLAGDDGQLPAPKRAKYVNMILTAATRAGELTGKLLASARMEDKPFSHVDLRGVVKDAMALLERTLDKRITLELEDAAADAGVLGDDSMLANLFMNLGINAGHAMPDGGVLVFALRKVDLDRAFCALSPFPLRPGAYVEVEVRDTGCGMSEATLGRVFEPFFTTKPPGQGTGLGLAVVYGTVQDHRGALTVASEVGAGTTFHVYLPAAAAPAGLEAARPAAQAGTGTLLLVDDEDVIRATTQTMLEQLGYKVLTAADGGEGVAVFRSAHETIGLVILDMIMPVLSGRQAFEAMQEIDPKVPVLLASGFTREDDLASMAESGLAGFIRKPYRINELSRTIAEAMRK